MSAHCSLLRLPLLLLLLPALSLCSATRYASCPGLATSTLSRAAFAFLHESVAEGKASILAVSPSGGSSLLSPRFPAICALHVGDVSEARALEQMGNVEQGRTTIEVFGEATKNLTSSLLPTQEMVLAEEGNSWKKGSLTCPQGAYVAVGSDGLKYCHWSLKNKLLTVSVFGMPPAIRIRPNAPWGGADVDIVKIIASHLQFDVFFKKEKFWGRFKDEKILEGGILGGVKHGSSDIGCGSLYINRITLLNLDMTATTYDSEERLCCRSPKPVPRYSNILLSFTLKSWLSIAFVGILGCLTAQILFWMAQLRKEKGTTAHSGNKEGFIFYGLLLSQARTRYSAKASYQNTNALRVMNGFWLVYALFILEIFSCNLRAYLVSKKYEKVANTLEELFEQERDWYLMDTPIFWQIFKSKNARAKAIPYPPGPLIPDHVQKAVQEEGACWICISHELKNVHDKEWGKRKPADMRFYRKGNAVLSSFMSAFVLKKRQPWKEDVNVVINRLYQAGIIYQLMMSNSPGWHLPFNEASNTMLTDEEGDGSEDQEPITVEHLTGHGIALGTGLAVAFVSWVGLEVRWRNLLARIGPSALGYLKSAVLALASMGLRRN